MFEWSHLLHLVVWRMREVDHGECAYVPRSGETWRDPYAMYAALRDLDPVHHVADGDYWVLTRFADVYEAARDHRRFSSAEGLTFTYGERERIGLDAVSPMVMMDPPDHTVFRRLVARAMTPRKVSAIADMVADFVRSRLDVLDGGDEVDLVTDLAMPVANLVVAHYLGVPAADRERFAVWTEAIVEANATGDVVAAGDRLAELIDYFAGLIADRRTAPGSDLLSLLLEDRTWNEADQDARILGFAFTMVAGGNDTAAGLIAGGTEILTQHRDRLPGLVNGRRLDATVVDELARLVSPVQGLARMTTTAVDVSGKQIPARRKVLLAYAAANRDPREFGGDAAEFEPRREIRRMLAFGSGAHHCLGAAAARLEVSVALGELFTVFPDLEVDTSGSKFAEGNYVRRYESLRARPGPRWNGHGPGVRSSGT